MPADGNRRMLPLKGGCGRTRCEGPRDCVLLAYLGFADLNSRGEQSRKRLTL